MHRYRDEIRETPRQQALRELRQAEEAERLTLPRLVGLTLFVIVFMWLPLIALVMWAGAVVEGVPA